MTNDEKILTESQADDMNRRIKQRYEALRDAIIAPQRTPRTDRNGRRGARNRTRTRVIL